MLREIEAFIFGAPIKISDRESKSESNFPTASYALAYVLQLHDSTVAFTRIIIILSMSVSRDYLVETFNHIVLANIVTTRQQNDR